MHAKHLLKNPGKELLVGGKEFISISPAFSSPFSHSELPQDCTLLVKKFLV